MSTDVDAVHVLSGTLWVSPEGRDWLQREDLPERPKADSVLPEGLPEWGSCDPHTCPAETRKWVEDGYLPLTPSQFWWSGMGSGESIRCGAWAKFISFTRGSADVVFVRDEGREFTGYRVEGGVAVEYDVVLDLGAPRKKRSNRAVKSRRK